MTTSNKQAVFVGQVAEVAVDDDNPDLARVVIECTVEQAREWSVLLGESVSLQEATP